MTSIPYLHPNAAMGTVATTAVTTAAAVTTTAATVTTVATGPAATTTQVWDSATSPRVL